MLKKKTVEIEYYSCDEFPCEGEMEFTGASHMVVKGELIQYEHKCSICGKFKDLTERYPR